MGMSGNRFYDDRGVATLGSSRAKACCACSRSDWLSFFLLSLSFLILHLSNISFPLLLPLHGERA